MKKSGEEKIIEMEPGEDGVFHPVTPYRRPNVEIHLHKEVKISPVYQFLDGFILGLEAIERFMRYTRRFLK